MPTWLMQLVIPGPGKQHIHQANYSWNNPGNWTSSPATYNYPGYASGDAAVFSTSGTFAANAPVLNSSLPYPLSSITVNNAANTTITVSNGYTLNITGGITVGSYSSTLLTFAGAGTTIITGTPAFNYLAGLQINSGATLTLNTSATFNNPPSFSNSGTFNLNNCSFPFTSSSSPTPSITNSGIINITGSSAVMNTNLMINNTGTINCSNGQLTSTGSLQSSGTINVVSAASITFNGTPSNFTNSGTLNLNTTGAVVFNNNNCNLQNTGTVISNTGILNMAGSGAYITNSGIFKVTATTLNFGNGNYIKNNASSSFTTQAGCVFNLTTSSSYISNAGTYTDHGSTYTMSGQNAAITNSGSGAVMQFRGSAVNFISGGGNTQNLTNSATLTADSATSISCNTYASYVNNTGIFNAGTSGSSCVISLLQQNTYVNNTNVFNLGSTSIIYPSGYTSTVSNQSAGIFTLQSDAAGSAAIGALSATATCTGTFNVQKYYQGGNSYNGRWVERNYRTISSPVNTGTQSNSNYIYGLSYIVGSTAGQTTAANSTTNAFVTGAAGGSTSAGNPTLYLYRENRAPSSNTYVSGNFIGITDITSAPSLVTTDGGTSTIPVGNGVFFFFRGNASNFSAKTNLPFAAPESVTFTQTGLINQQSVTVKNWYTPTSSNLGYTTATANAAVRGYNLVGNPYPCSIDWNTSYSGSGITLTNVNPAIYVFNPVTSQYDTYITTSASSGTATGKASNIITSGQGFFVQANGTGASLVFTEAAKSAPSQLTGTSLLFAKRLNNSVTPATEEQSLRLKLSLDSLDNDDIYIGFSSTASINYNRLEDALYLPGMNAPEGLASVSDDGKALAINVMPMPKLKPQVIKLKVAANKSALYTLERSALTGIPAIYDIWLMDNYKKDSLDLKHNTAYAFNVNINDTTTYGSNRFSIVIRQNPALAVHLLNFTASKAASGVMVKWDTENEANYTNFTVQRSTNTGSAFAALGGYLSNYAGSYSFTDDDPATPLDKYRLMLTDLNGNVTYSNIVTLSYGNQNTVPGNVSVYPNPASSVINLAIKTLVNTSGPLSNSFALNIGGAATSSPPAASVSAGNAPALYTVKIISTTGAVLKTVTSATPSLQENISFYTPGTYIIQVVNKKDNSLIGKGTFVKL